MKEYKGYTFYCCEDNNINNIYAILSKNDIYYFVTGDAYSKAPIIDYFTKFIGAYLEDAKILSDEYCDACIEVINNPESEIVYDHLLRNVEASSRDALDTFLRRIREEYVKARKPIEEDDGHIIRGRSHYISSIAEDLLAKCYRDSLGYLGESIYVFVDRSLSTKIKISYPDLIIAKKLDENTYKAYAMVDLKQDVGWIRDSFKEISNKHNEYCKKLINLKTATTYIDKGESKKEIKVLISKNLRYDTFIISPLNAGSKKKAENLIQLSDDRNNNILVLDRNLIAHPNDYNDLYEENMEPNFVGWRNYLLDVIDRLQD